MINIEDYLDYEKICIYKSDDEISICRKQSDGTADPEIQILLKFKENRFLVCEQNRNDIYVKGEFEEENVAYGLFIALYHESYERNYNFKDDADYEEAASQKDFKKIDSLILKYCNKEHFSLLEEKDKAVCMLKNDELFDVVYINGNNRRVIVKEYNLYLASAVTRNYANKLRDFEQLFEKLSEDLGLESDLHDSFLEHYMWQ